MFWKPLTKTIKQIGFKLALWYSGTLFLFVLIFFACTYIFLSSVLKTRDFQNIEIEISEVKSEYNTGGERRVQRFVNFHMSSRLKNNLFIRIADSENKTRYLISPFKKDNFPVNRLEKVFMKHSEFTILKSTVTNHELNILTVALSDGSFLQLGMSSEERDNILYQFRHLFYLGIIPFLLIGVAGGIFLSMRALSPLKNIINTVKAINDGKMTSRVNIKDTGDELDDLAHLFNEMLDKINRLINEMEESLDNVSHDLRTPLTRLRIISEDALSKWPDTDVSRKSHIDVIEESERIIKMLNTIMDISEADAGVMLLKLETLSLANLVAPIYELYLIVAEEKNLAITNKITPDLFILADHERISQAIANLVDNAVKYTPPNGYIIIDSKIVKNGIKIIIINSGTIISSKDIPKIWNRLYRGDQSRTHKGLGLGLSFVKAIVSAHNGLVDVSCTPEQTTSFSIYLPA